MLSRYKFTEKEITELVNSMVILIDTREKKFEHITKYFDKVGIPYKIKSLKYGDYSFYIPQNEKLGILRDLYFDDEIIVERKNSLDEIAGNFTNGRDRFEKEMCLAPTSKVIVIENASYKDMCEGNYRSEYLSKSFWGTYHSFWHKYGVPIMFMPDNNQTGMFIRGFFTYYLKNIIHR